MQKIQYIIIALVLMATAACETNLLQTTITDGTAPVLSTSATELVLNRADSANTALSLNWTNPNYLEDTSNGDVVGSYLLEIGKDANFITAKSYSFLNQLETSFSVYSFNKLLLDMDYEPDVVQDLFIRVKSIYFTEDTLSSEIINLTVTPYTTVIPPSIAVPSELWIVSDGLEGAWVQPFPAERQFEKVSDTKFTITIFIAASTEYEMITDGTGSNWTPCYRIDPAQNPEDMLWGGTFVWDGEGSDYSWGSKKFMSPPQDGLYKITMDFQTAEFTVEDVTGPPAIEVPEELWIYSDGLEGGWIQPFPEERKFEKVGKTKFTISIFIAGNNEYEMITDGEGANWTPCYRIDPALDPAEMIWEGSFVWDGDGSDYSWGSKKFLSPPDDGVYKITLDFQTATYNVVSE